MSDSRITGRYARSLIGLAVEKNLLEPIKNDMEQIARVIAANPELGVMLHSPVVRFDKKLKVLNQVFKGLNPLSVLFIDNIARKSREAYLEGIAREFINQYNEMKKIGTATVVSAVPLSDNTRQKVAGMLKDYTGYQTILVQSEVDPNIIGGLVIRFGDRLIDASIRQNLNQIKKALV